MNVKLATAMKPRGSSLRREITAYHEAGHAVMAFRFGFPVEAIAICDKGPWAGYVQIKLGRQLIKKALRYPHLKLPWAELVRNTERWAMVYLAGPIAEARRLGLPMRAQGGKSDFNRCLSLCNDLNRYRKRCVAKGASIKVIEPFELANRLRQQTAVILGRPEVWRAVISLANDLRGWSELSGSDAAESAEYSRRVRNQLGLSLVVPDRP